MKKRFFIVFAVALYAGLLFAQDPFVERPQRTPMEEALKQTMRLVRELGIHDSVRIDTLFKMHLKYAVKRQQGLTRAQNMERMQAITQELQNLLTQDEFERFMNHPAEKPRRPHGANRMMPASEAPNAEAPNTPEAHTANQ